MKLFYCFEGVYTCTFWLRVVFTKKVVWVFLVFLYQCSDVTMLGVLQMDEKQQKDRTSGGAKLIRRSADLGCHTKICIWVLHQKPR